MTIHPGNDFFAMTPMVWGSQKTGQFKLCAVAASRQGAAFDGVKEAVL
jgi:hypothetical protein